MTLWAQWLMWRLADYGPMNENWSVSKNGYASSDFQHRLETCMNVYGSVDRINQFFYGMVERLNAL